MTSFDMQRRTRTPGTPNAQNWSPGAPQSATSMGTMNAPEPAGLPPTGIQQQLASLNRQYAAVRGARGVGFDVAQDQFQRAQGMQEQGALQRQQMGGSTSLDALARSLAQSYGLAIGRGRLVDDRGNMLMTPDQLANASGGAETLGSAAVKLQYISQAVSRQQNEQQQQKGISAIQAGMGQVQERGRGSLAAMQSGFYQDLADLYANKEYQAADFSYWVNKEQLDIQQSLMRRKEKLAKRQGYAAMGMGIGMMFAGNYAGGGAMLAGGASQAGWF